MVDSEGVRRFREWLATRTQAEAAALLGVAQQTVSAWKRGVLVPSALQRVRLQLLTGISVNAWGTEVLTPAECKLLAKMTPAPRRAS